jgi:hypothetical protein
LAAKNITTLINKQNKMNYAHKKQIQHTKQIKQKLQEQEATLIEADKRKTMVIIYKQNLEDKIQHFIDGNNIKLLKKDPSQIMYRQIQTIIKECNTLIEVNKRKSLLQMNLRAPTLKVKIKVHKPEAPTRPIINNIEAPSYKLASYLQSKLEDYLTLKNEYNSVNSITFAENIMKIRLKSNHKMLTMDIKDLYVNIPIKETINITKQTLINNTTNTQIVKEITQALHTILLLNYFQHNGKYYKPKTGIAIGSPISSITAEIFLQYMEQLLIKHSLEQRTLIYYNRYVDDIFII